MTTTTRCPAAMARAIRPADRYASSSGRRRDRRRPRARRRVPRRRRGAAGPAAWPAASAAVLGPASSHRPAVDDGVARRPGGHDERRALVALDPAQGVLPPRVALGVLAHRRRVDHADRRGRAARLGELDEAPAAPRRDPLQRREVLHGVRVAEQHDRLPVRRTRTAATSWPRPRPGSRRGRSGRDRRRRRAGPAAARWPSAGSRAGCRGARRPPPRRAWAATGAASRARGRRRGRRRPRRARPPA